MEPTASAATVQRETRSSVELTRNAKGDYQWSIKLYLDSNDDADFESALERLETVDATLRTVYLGAPAATIAA